MENYKRSFPAWVVEHCNVSPENHKGEKRLVINYYETPEDLNLSNIVGTVHDLPLYTTWKSIFHPEFGHFYNFVCGMDAEYAALEADEASWTDEHNQNNQ